MRTNEARNQKLLFGTLLAALWLIGLFVVVDAESLMAKAVVLLALAPLSLELDRLVSRIFRPRALKQVLLVPPEM